MKRLMFLLAIMLISITAISQNDYYAYAIKESGDAKFSICKRFVRIHNDNVIVTNSGYKQIFKIWQIIENRNDYLKLLLIDDEGDKLYFVLEDNEQMFFYYQDDCWTEFYVTELNEDNKK